MESCHLALSEKQSLDEMRPSSKRTALKNITNLESENITVVIHKQTLDTECRVQGDKNPKYQWTSKSSGITREMRMILVDWLSEVVEDCDGHSSTLHLTVDYIDRYLGVESIVPEKLQLLGVASLLVASKLDETHPCTIKELVDVCDGCFSPQQIRAMELQLIRVLEFRLHVPTLYSITLVEMSEVHPGLRGRSLALVEFTLELCLTNIEVLRYRHLEIARGIAWVLLETIRTKDICVDKQLLNLLRSMLTEEYIRSVAGIVSKFTQRKYYFAACMFGDQNWIRRCK